MRIVLLYGKSFYMQVYTIVEPAFDTKIGQMDFSIACTRRKREGDSNPVYWDRTVWL
jgi:hypothetical protein